MPDRSRLIDRKEVAADTMSFTFDRPAGYVFTAGQFMNITLVDPPDFAAEDTKRHFTISSAPFEDGLTITTRIRGSAFKRALRETPDGPQVELARAAGKFTLHEDASQPAVFLSGGIGVTAPRAILLQALHDGREHKIYHFYSDQRPEDAAFLMELQRLAHEHRNYVLVPTMTHLEGSQQNWQGETRRIEMGWIRDFVPGDAAIYYASGPPQMVKDMKKMLLEAGIGEQNIRTEEYTGY